MKGWIWLLIAGILATVGGVIALFNPIPATLAAVMLTGWMFLIVGVIEFIGVFSAETWGGRIWSLVLAALCVVLGLYILGNPITSALALTWLAGILFLATGATKVVLSFSARGTGYFAVVILSGIVSVILGVMVLSNFPYSATAVLGILLAVELISSGIANIAMSLHMRDTQPA